MTFQSLIDDASRNAAGSAMRAFFEGVKSYLPPGTSVLVLPVIDEFDQQTGQLTGSNAIPTPPAVVTSNAAPTNYAGGTGIVVQWNTTLIYHGRRVRGRTFIVPTIQAVFDTDGTLTTAAQTTVSAAAQALVTASADLGVWARWFGKPAQAQQIDGAVASVTSQQVKDFASHLRSRRS